MAIVIARQKMTVRHAEGEHTIFPSAQPQILPDHLLNHDHVQGAIKSGWITVQKQVEEPAEPGPTVEPEAEDKPEPKKVRGKKTV